MRRTHLVMLSLALSAAVLFTAFPEIDLFVARQFYGSAGHFPFAQNPYVRGIFDAITWLSRIAAVALLLAIIAGSIQASGFWRSHRRRFAFVLFAMALGPGLIVNTGLKDHWGRARPSHITEFGGTKKFTPALVVTDQCVRNCAFSSGHIAVAFFPAVVALIAPKRRRTWLFIGIVGAVLAALGRMAGGSHFLSDGIFSVVIVWFTAAALHWRMFPPSGASLSQAGTKASLARS
jgi:lipid A 4'-phosphatase